MRFLMSGRRLLALAIVFGNVATTACFADFSGLSDGPVDASINTETGAAEAGPADGGADSRADVGSDASIDAGRLCSAVHDLCDDFDQDPFPNRATWAAPVLGMGGSVHATSAGSRSAPNAMVASIHLDGDAGVGSIATLRKDLVAGKKTVCDFYLRLDKVDDLNTGAYGAPWRIVVSPTASQPFAFYTLSWDQRTLGSGMTEFAIRPDGGEYSLYHDGPVLVRGAWTHVQISLTFGTPSHFRMILDGTPAFDFDVSAPSALEAQTLSFGLDKIGWTTGAQPRPSDWSALYDDVFCDVTR